MPISSSLRAIFNKLQFLLRPVPLASTVGILLLGLFIWEYSTHPEWFGAYIEDASPSGDEIDLSGLTPEEQAAISGIDNLSVLFNELGIDSEARPQVQSLSESPEADANAFLQGSLALSQPSDSGGGLSDSPFTEYLEQYRFAPELPSASNRGSAANDGALGTVGLRRGQNGQMQSTTAISPLTAALQALDGTLGNNAAMGDNPLANELRSQSAAVEGMTANPDGSTNTATDNAEESAAGSAANRLPVGPFSDQTVSIPGVPYPVLPTQPQMSPPPGTTGYTPPASLELMPPLPGNNSTNALPAPGSSSLAPASGAAASGSALPTTGTANVDVSNGYTPYTPVVPEATPLPTMTPVPFSAPRPPGSSLGGGYINTFSNPSTPRN